MQKRPVALQAAAFTLVGCIALAAAAEELLPRWTSRVIKIGEPKQEGRDLPVVSTLSVHPSGRLLATAGDDHHVHVWKFTDGSLVRRLSGHDDWVRAIAYSPDGRRLATAGNDRRIVMWDADDGQQLRIIARHRRPITALCFSPDGRLLATIGYNDPMHIYDVASGRQRFQVDCPCRDMRCIAFSPDGKTVAAGGRNGRIRIWNTADAAVVHQYQVHQRRIRDLAFSADGRRLASCGDDRLVNVLDLENGSSTKLPIRPCKVYALAFVDADQLATAGSDNEIRIWSLAGKSEIARLSGHTGTISVLVEHDGLLISGSYDTSVRVWTQGNSVAGEQPRPVRRVGTSEFKLE